MITIKSKGGKTLTCASKLGLLLVFPEGGCDERPEKGGAGIVLLDEVRDVQQDGVVSWPGEYDYGNVAIRGIGRNGHVSYVVTINNLRCGFISSPLGEWSDYEIGLLGDLDVLVVPAEDTKKVQMLVEEVDPPVIIPLRTKESKAFQEVVAACGGKDVEPVREVKVGKSSLPTDSREIYVLEA